MYAPSFGAPNSIKQIFMDKRHRSRSGNSLLLYYPILIKAIKTKKINKKKGRIELHHKP
jgi:hypothetical protein